MGDSLKCRNCYLPFSWLMFLLLAFLSVLVSKPAHSRWFWEEPFPRDFQNIQARRITLADYDCTAANASLDTEMDFYTTYFEDRGCIDIQASQRFCLNAKDEKNNAGCSGYYAYMTAKTNPAVPGSCQYSNFYMPEGGSVAVKHFISSCQPIRKVQSCPESARSIDPSLSCAQVPPSNGVAAYEHCVLMGNCYCPEGGLVTNNNADWDKCLLPQPPTNELCRLSPREACISKCGTEQNISFEICLEKPYFTSFLFPPVCVCKQEPEPPECNWETGEGCATYDKQRQQLDVMQRIQLEIDRGKLHYSGIEGVYRKNDGTFTDIKTILTQIANSSGILSSGGGSGGSGTGTGTGSGEGDGDTFTAPGAGKGYGDATSQIQTTINERKQELSDAIQAIQQSFLTYISDTSSFGVGSLPCWQGLPLFGGLTFDICFKDSESALSRLPIVMQGLAFIVAGFVLFRGGKA